MTRGRLDGRMERWLRWRGGGSLGEAEEDKLIGWLSVDSPSIGQFHLNRAFKIQLETIFQFLRLTDLTVERHLTGDEVRR